MLTSSGERNAEHETQQEGYYRLERAFGGFARSLTLPTGIEVDAVQAQFDRGVLEIRIPKPEQKEPRHVQIQLGTGAGEGPKTTEAPKPPTPRPTAATQ